MFKRSNLFTILAAVAVIAAGCSRLGGYSRVISCNVSDEAADEAADKSTVPVISLDNLKTMGFGMDVWLPENLHNEQGDIDAHYFTAVVNWSDTPDENGANWIITPSDGQTKYWLNQVPTRFWCVAPPDAHGFTPSDPNLAGSTSMSFSYAVPGIPANRSDLVLAYASKSYEDGGGNTIDLKFRHPLSQVMFILNEDFSENIDIVDISLKGIKNYGECVLANGSSSTTGNFTWSNQSGNATITETATKATIAQTNFFVVPQSLAEGAELVVTLRRTTDNSTFTRSAPISGTVPWNPGYYYKYRLSATEALSQPIAFEVSLDSWAAWDGGNGYVDITNN